MPRVLIVTVNYCTPNETIRCIESVLKLTHTNWQMAIVENGSSDQSDQILSQWMQNNLESVAFNPSESWPHSSFVYLKVDQNLGFSGGNNYAIRKSLAASQNSNSVLWDYVWLLNNDAQTTPEALSLLLEAGENNNQVGVLGTTLLDDTAPYQLQGYGGSFCPFNGRAHHIYQLEQIHKVDYVVGASMLIKKAVIDKIGLMVEDYFLYYEEADFCWKAKSAGFLVQCVPEAVVYHACGASSCKPIREYYYVRNLLYFTWNHRKCLFIQSLWYVLFTRCLMRYKQPEIRKSAFLGMIAFLSGLRGMSFCAQKK